MDSKENNGDEMTDQNDQGEGAVGADASVNDNVPNQQQTADILKLDIDCFEEVFDYSPREDLLAVGNTCKRLNNVAGLCYNQSYKAIEHHVIQEEEHFAKFIPKIRITQHLLRNFPVMISKYKPTQIRVFSVDFTRNHFEGLNEVLSKVDVLQIHECLALARLYETLLAHCTKLTRLCVDCLSCNDSQWLYQRYPTLKRFEISLTHPDDDMQFEDVVSFLQQNLNIRKFAIGSRTLEQNLRLMMEANIELDDLAILMLDLSEEQQLPLFRLLNQLHEHGIYKRLQLYFIHGTFNQQIANHLVSMNGLVKLNIADRKTMSLLVLVNLEELYIFDAESISNLMDVAIGFTKIKRISFGHASIDNIVPFISRAAGLEKIRISCIERSAMTIDLPALNAQREQLGEASNLTLYVREEYYLATKWAMKGRVFDLIKLKRLESYEWDQDFQTLSLW